MKEKIIQIIPSARELETSANLKLAPIGKKVRVDIYHSKTSATIKYKLMNIKR